MNRNVPGHFSRTQQMRGSVPRSSNTSGQMYSTGKPVQRSLSGGAVDYQRSTSSHYRVDNRAGHSPVYNRVGTSSGKQSYQNSLVTSSSQSMHGLSNHSSSQHSIHSLPGINLGSSSSSSHSIQSAPVARSAPASMDSQLNDNRQHSGSWQGKPGANNWHSGPPFYGPQSSNDPSSFLQSGRSASAPKSNGNFPQNSAQFSASAGVRQGSLRGPLHKDDNTVNDQRLQDRSRMMSQMNATSNGVVGQGRGQGKVPRAGKY